MGKLGLTESGEVPIGPPTADQAAFLSSTQDDARKLAADQEAMRDLRTSPLATKQSRSNRARLAAANSTRTHARGGREIRSERAPKLPPGTGDKMRSWDEVSKAHTDLGDVIRARVATNPLLFGLVKGGNEDATRAKEVGGGSRESALGQLGRGGAPAVIGGANARHRASSSLHRVSWSHGRRLGHGPGELTHRLTHTGLLHTRGVIYWESRRWWLTIVVPHRRASPSCAYL